MQRSVIILACLWIAQAISCGSGEVRSDIPIRAPETITLKMAQKEVAEAQEELEKEKLERLPEYAPQEFLKAEQFVRDARTELNEENEEPAYYHAAKAKAYLRLARAKKELEIARNQLKSLEEELR
ncbi:MAG: hypothetical protein NZM25_10080 [Leptospiraceae bacterium]|nr:hypothetical protein [Leptospiraceae bacterium]MDW8307497.1 hypothetical protein [Leptospiraceae bacterium]